MLTTFCSHFTKFVRDLHQYSHTVDGNDGHTKHTDTSRLGRGGGGGKKGREGQQSFCIAIKTKGKNFRLLASSHKTYLTYRTYYCGFRSSSNGAMWHSIGVNIHTCTETTPSSTTYVHMRNCTYTPSHAHLH